MRLSKGFYLSSDSDVPGTLAEDFERMATYCELAGQLDEAEEYRRRARLAE